MGGYQTTFNVNTTAFVPSMNAEATVFEPKKPSQLFEDLPKFKLNVPSFVPNNNSNSLQALPKC
jgi:hypothetical protein